MLQFRAQPAIYRKSLEKIRSEHRYLPGCFTERTLPASLIAFYQTLVSLWTPKFIKTIGNPTAEWWGQGEVVGVSSPLQQIPACCKLVFVYFSTAVTTYNRGSAQDIYSLPIVQLNALVTFVYNIKTQHLSPNVLHMMLCLFTSTLYADEFEQPRPKSIKMPSESESIDSKIWSTMFSGLEEGTGIKAGSLSSS